MTLAADPTASLQAATKNYVDTHGGGGSITWPATNDLVISNSTSSPTGLAPVNGDCVVGSGGLWVAGACGSGGGITALTGPVTASGSGSVATSIALGAGSITGILSGTLGGTGVNNGSNTISTSLPFAITGSGAQTFFFGNSGVPWTYNFPQVSGNLAYQVGSIVSGHAIIASGTAGGIADGGAPVTFANPTATAGPAAVNGSATTAMRSDGAPAIQKGSNAQFGIVEGDGSTINCVAGVCTSIGGSATSIVPGTTTIGGATAPCVIENTGTTVMGCTAETGTGSFVRATSPTLVTPALGTPASGVATNLTGTAASLTAGTATAANGLNSATTTVSVNGATAPTTGQALIATSGTTATWQTVSASASSITPGTTTVVGATAPCVISNSATTVMNCIAETGTGSVVLATSPTLTTPALGTPSALVGTNISGTASGLTAGVATAANGIKTATTTVSVSGATAPTSGQALVATSGTNATWQTVSGSGTLTGLTQGTPDILFNGTTTCTSGSCAVSTTVPLNTQSGASYAILTTDNTTLIEMTNASPTTMTIPVANSTGFLSGWGASVVATLATTTITPASGTICGLSSVSLQPGQFLSIGAGAATDYACALGLPPTVPSGTIASGKNLGIDSSNRLVVATVSGGSSAFSALTSGTNTAAAMVIGTGASIAASGSGAITATAAPVSGLTAAGTGVVTALGNNLSAAGGLTTTIASGTSAMGTGAISSAACATVVTTTATNTATTDVVAWGFNSDPTGVTGYTPVTTGALTIFAYPSANNVNFKVCNLTGSSITPGAITLNWRVAR